ncbi:hypothetical protein glysoja_004369 [Glycine soja]|nr:hypothetical protein glysoja_004369 [Glycine soja]
MELHPPPTLSFFSLLRTLLNDNIRLTGKRNDDPDSHPDSHPKLSICNEAAEGEEEAPTGPDRFTSSRTGSLSHTITSLGHSLYGFPAKRTRGMRLKPHVDALSMETVIAFGQYPTRFPVLEL